jgi:hypothetical protein
VFIWDNRPVRSPAPPTDAVRGAVVILVAGLATGILTQIGQGVLPDGWSSAANAISPWLFVAFLVGSTMASLRSAALAGIGILVLAIIGYDAMILVRYGYGPSLGSSLFWGIAALAGGPVFGIAGYAWRTGTHPQRAAALGLLVALGVAEGIYNSVVLGSPGTGAAFVLIGLLMPVLLARSADDRIGAYVASIPALGLAGLGYVVFIWLNGLTATI